MSRKVDGIKATEARAWQQLVFLSCTLRRSLPRAANATQDRAKQPKAAESELRAERRAPHSMNLLVVLPLLLLAEVQVEQVRAEVKAVKLCGREFLRAVVYTCGGSRWRRFLSDTDMDADVPALPAGEQNSLESLSSSSSSSSSSLSPHLSRRDFNSMVTSMCCQVGCKKSDLTFLC